MALWDQTVYWARDAKTPERNVQEDILHYVREKIKHGFNMIDLRIDTVIDKISNACSTRMHRGTAQFTHTDFFTDCLVHYHRAGYHQITTMLVKKSKSINTAE